MKTRPFILGILIGALTLGGVVSANGPFGGGGGGISGLTTNLVPKATSATALGDSSCYPISVTNESVTGTTVNKLAKFNTADATAIITSTTETAGILGIVISGAGTTGSAVVCTLGNASCVSDNTTTKGHFVGVSTSVTGDCTDLATNDYTALTAGTTVLGTWSEAGAAGARAMFLGTPDVQGQAGGGGGGGSKVNGTGANTRIAYWTGTSTLSSSAAWIFDGTKVVTLSAGSAGGIVQSKINNTNTGSTAGTDAELDIQTAGSATGANGSNPVISFLGPGVAAGASYWTMGVARDSGSNSPFDVAWGTNNQFTNVVLSITGSGTGQVEAGCGGSGGGAVATPCFALLSDPKIGWWSSAANTMSFSTNSVESFDISPHASYISNSNSGASNLLQVANSSNTASSDAALYASTAGTSAGNSMVRLIANGATNGSWTLGHASGNNPTMVLSNSDGSLTSGRWQVDTSGNMTVLNGGHVNNTGGTAPTATSCGTTTTTVSGSTDSAGAVVPSGTQTTCTVTFANAYTNAPICVVTDDSNVLAVKVAPTASNMVLTSLTSMGTDTVSWICVGK